MNTNMRKIVLGLMVAAGVLAVSAASTTTKTTYRDAQGRLQGTVTTDRYGKTTWRDSMGRLQGSATTDRYGKTTYRDSLGRVTGTKTTK